MDLHILLIEDDLDALKQFERDLPDHFSKEGITAKITSCSSFDDGLEKAKSTHERFDLIISDTYKGDQKDKDAAVIDTIVELKKGKFCPIIVCSSGECPPVFTTNYSNSPFILWADKAKSNSLEDAITLILETGIPQTAKNLHDEIDISAGEFLWEFIEKNWSDFDVGNENTKSILERIIRRRASLAISDLQNETYSAINQRSGLEYYIYPSLKHSYYSLGDIIQNKKTNDFRVILTPHCQLFIQPGQTTPRAEFILTVKTVLVESIIGKKIENNIDKDQDKQHRNLKLWSRSPAQTTDSREGRHWYLPKFLKIPHLYCDFLQVESVPYADIKSDYESVATLMPPYAEALQECFSSFYSSVGIPQIDPNSISDLIPSIQEP